MTDFAQIALDPEWIVHRYDSNSGRFQFIRAPLDAIRAETFAADLKPSSKDQEEWVDAKDLIRHPCPTVPINFVFHTAFCRSTLLISAFDIPGVSFGISEPAVLNDLALAGPQATQFIEPVLRLLARPLGGAKTIVVKPSNVANGIIAHLLGADPNAKALLLSNSLSDFLQSVNKKGLAGRVWVRRLYRHVQGYAGLNFGFRENAEFELSDLQVASLAWFLQLRHFAMLLDTPLRDRLATMSASDLGEDRGKALLSTSRHFELPVDAARIQDIANSQLFQKHAKLGGDYAQIIETQASAARSRIVDEEIEIIEKWIEVIAGQNGLRLPVRKPVQDL